MSDLDTILQQFASFIEDELPPPDVERLVGTATVRPTRRPRWRPVVVFAGAGLTILMIGVPTLVFGVLSSVPSSEAPVTVTTAPVTVTTAPVTAAPAVIPALGEGWEIVLSTRPGDTLFLEPEPVFPTDAGYYVKFLNVETSEIDWYLATFDGGERTLVDIDVPGSTGGGGFVTGGPGVVAWTNVGPTGCERVTGCQGSEIYAANASPTGRVVALAYDPLVWNAECECYELNPVALVSDDGHMWTRHPLDLLSVLPPEWQGAADIRSPLVHVAGRWLTYATHYSNDCMCTDTAFFASENGIDWQLVDTGELFVETYLLGMASNDSGVVAIMNTSAYWSPDGIQWSRSAVTSDAMLQKIAAYDDGYVAVGSSIVDEGTPAVGSIDRIWYSTDGTAWTQIAFEFEETTHWNALVGDGPSLLAVGSTENHERGIWRWFE